MICSCHLWCVSPGFVSEYVPVGSSEQLSRFLIVKSFMYCQTRPLSLLQLGRSWSSALDSPTGSSWTSYTISWNCREMPAESECAPHSPTIRTPTSRKHTVNLVAKLCCCFVDLRFQRTSSATMLVTKACHGDLGFVV